MEKTSEQNELLEKKYQILMDFMPGGVVIYRGEDGAILESRGLGKLLGGGEAAQEQPEPVNFYQMLYPEDVDRVKELIETQLEFLHSVFLNVSLSGAGKEVCLCEYRGRILSEENGERIYMALLKDRNEEELLRRTLRQREEELLVKDELTEAFRQWAGEAAFTYDKLEDELSIVFGSGSEAGAGCDGAYGLPHCYRAFWQEQRLKRWLDEESVRKTEEAYRALGGKKDSGSLIVTMAPEASFMPGRQLAMDYKAVLNDRGSVLYVTGRLRNVNE